MVQWGDIPTWVTVGVAFLALIGAALAYRTQSEQLRLQRIQLEDQTRVQEREQANQVDVVWQHIDPSALLLLDEFANVDKMLVVVNNSRRPIHIVASKVERSAIGQEPEPRRLPDASGELRPYPPGRQEDTFIVVGGPVIPLIKAGAKGGFIWLFADRPGFDWIQYWVRFTDDAGLHWEIDHSLHLEKLAQRDW
jgi:hypothetical protein